MKTQKKTRKAWTLQHAPQHHLKQAQKNKHSVDSQLQSPLTDLVLTQKINEQWLTLWFSSRHRQSSQQFIKHTHWGFLLFLNFWASTFIVVCLWLSEIQATKFSITSFPIHFTVSPAAERLRYILGDEEEAMPTPTLFTEMDTLQHEGDELEWKESARYKNTLTKASQMPSVLQQLETQNHFSSVAQWFQNNYVSINTPCTIIIIWSLS